MNRKFKLRNIIIVPVIILLTSFQSLVSSKLSVNMKSQILNEGNVSTIEAEVFYNYDGRMITRFIKPMEYLFLANANGEAKIYYPDKNEVMLHQNITFSTKLNPLYFFVSNRTYDLGIEDLGFGVKSTNFENDMMVTLWEPFNKELGIKHIKLVHENDLPIYLAVYDENEFITKKTYYSNYSYNKEVLIPMKITMINYTSDTDSTISRIIYDNLKVGIEANSEYFDFKIPSDAKISQ